MNKQPNILFLFTDQQRADTIAALGNPFIKTPALDRIARSGTAFTSAYSPCPVCVPARCCMHYGQYPARTGCYENGYPMPTDRPSYAQALSDAGYRTHSVGKCHFSPDKYALRGFQTREVQEEIPERNSDDYTRWLQEQGWGDLPEPHGVRGEMYYIPQVSQLPARLHPTQWVGDRSIEFLRSQRNSDKPWMLFSSYIHPHPAFAPPAPWHKLYRSYQLPPPHVPETSHTLLAYVNRHQNRYKYRDQGTDHHLVRNIKAHYYACISFVDYQIGRILDTLDAIGQRENTLILFASDHGELLGDFRCFGKRSMHDAAARVPLLASMPGRFDGGRRCDRPASLVDVMPTILAAAGCGTQGLTLDGIDLASLLDGSSQRDAVYSQYRAAGQALYTAVTDDWKYAYSAADQREFLFDRRGRGPEQADAAGRPDTERTLRSLRSSTLDWLRGLGESAALDGDRWKVYPRLEMPVNPDAGLISQDPGGFVLDLPGYSDPA